MRKMGKDVLFRANIRTGLIVLALAIVITEVFLPLGRHEFVRYDDTIYVTENGRVQAGLTAEGIRWALSATHASNWHPLTWFSHMLDVEFFGMDPGRHHLSSLLLHTLNTVILFLVLRAMTGTLWRSAAVAAFFGLHPLHVESVAWISERKDVLSTFFWMLTLAAYLRYVRLPGAGPYLLTAVLFALGLTAKPMLVTLPLVLLLLDFWPLGRFSVDGIPPTSTPQRLPPRTFSHLLLEKVPLLLLSIFSGTTTYLAQREGGATEIMALFPLVARAANALVSYIGYICKMLWPHSLAVFYPHPYLINDLSPWLVGSSALLLTTITFQVLRRALRYPFLITGWFWYLGTLVPVIGLLQVGMQARADRYTYVPLVGLFIMTVWGGTEILPKGRSGRAAAAAVSGIILAFLVPTARTQLNTWSNSRTLFQHALDVTENNVMVHRNLATVLQEEGDYAGATSQLEAALLILPRDTVVHNNLGVILFEEGNTESARNHYIAALDGCFEFFSHPLKAPRSECADPHYNLGILLKKEGKSGQAAAHFNKALGLQPDHAGALNNLGIILEEQGSLEGAERRYRRSLSLDPGLFEAYANLGGLLVRQGRLAEAWTVFAAALRMRPDDAEAHNNAGFVLEAQGKHEEAEIHIREALRIDPEFPDAYYYLGNTLASQGRYEAAANAYRRTLLLRSDFPEARANLEWTREQIAR